MLDRVRLPRSSEVARYRWFFAAFLYVFFLSISASRLSWDIWAGLAFIPILGAITIPLLKFGLRKDPDPMIGKIVVVAFVAKMFGAGARYALTYGLYERADASEYHESGARLAAAFWDGTFAQVSQTELPELTGTPFVRLVTGIIYIATTPTIFGGFVIFSWLSFLGLFFFYKAARIGFPEGNLRRYAYLVFFLPSMIYWPSSIGKEAWISFGLGLASYGVALILRHQPLGYPVAGLGLLATAGPRPHITVLCVVALAMAYVLRRRSWRDSTLGPVGKFVGIGVMLVVGVVVVSKAASFFEVDSASNYQQVLDYADQQSGQGGSEYEAVSVKSPAQFPSAFLAVLFRPWPWEAGSAQALIASAEGTFLLVLGAISLPRLVKLPMYVLQVPYLAYAVTYTIMFVIAFSSIGNFGILTRQRTQVLPLVALFFILPTERQRIDEYTETVHERADRLNRKPRGPSPLS